MRTEPGGARLAVKICGLTAVEQVEAACAAGASYVGFVFVPASPRAVSPAEAGALAPAAAPGCVKTGLFVDPDDAAIDAALEACPLDLIQLHGTETPDRVVALRERIGLPVMKAVPIATEADLASVTRYEGVVDQILVDAKAEPGAAIPGGGGVPFDWRLIAGRRWSRPWMLAGGLTPENVAEAARLTGATQVDVSSGVEARRGVKSIDKIRAFCDAARSWTPSAARG